MDWPQIISAVCMSVLFVIVIYFGTDRANL